MNAGWIGAIVGVVIGIIGGIIGTYFSIKNTNGPRERAFLVKASVVVWVAGTLFLGLMLALSDPHRSFLWILFVILLPLGIYFGNRTQQRIRKEESQNQGSQATL